MPLVSKSFSDIITFSRGSNATYFDSAGVLKYAPNNLLVQSEDFTTTWSTLQSSISPNAVIAPNGLTTADKFVEDLDVNQVHNVRQSGVTVVSLGTYSASCYAKADTRTKIRIGFLVGGTGGVIADADLVAGTITGPSAFGGGVAVSSSIQPAGNGWYRIAATGIGPAGTSGELRLELLDASGNRQYNGDGTSGLYIWGAQLNIGLLQPYYPTQATAYYGPRFDYNPATLAAQGLLIEEQRTNLLTYSEDFGNAAWTKGGATVSTDTTTAPTGTTVADSLIEDSSTGSHRTYRTVSGTTNTNPYTVSVFAKANTRTRIYLALVEGASFSRQGNAVFDLSTGTIVVAGGGSNGATGGSATIQNVGNGWYRCSYTLTLGGTDTAIFSDINLVSTGTTISYTGDGTSGLFLFGAQLEAGAFPTSYIPTTTTALTRSADVASVNTLSPWYNAAEGTLYAEFSAYNTSASRLLTQLDDTGFNNRIFAFIQANNGMQTNVIVGGSSVAQLFPAGTYTSPAIGKISQSYAVDNFASCFNGGVVSTDTSGALPTVTQMRIGFDGGSAYVNGHLRRITYYPRRLSNAELQAITTP